MVFVNKNIVAFESQVRLYIIKLLKCLNKNRKYLSPNIINFDLLGRIVFVI
jgi:hypothetical protein